MIRKTAHSFSKQFNGNYGQVRDIIVLEATWLGYYEPYFTKQINSFVGDMMINSGQTSIAKDNGMLPFNVQVLDPKRTICEKIMSLVRFSYGESPRDDLKNKIRHLYDLHKLMQKQEFIDFLASNDFETMLLKVVNDDVKSFKSNNKWLENHPHKALIFSGGKKMWDDLMLEYNTKFKYLVYGELPSDANVLKSLSFLIEKIKNVAWDIKV